MIKSIINATGYKRVFDLVGKGRISEAKVLLKSLQDEYLAVYEENEILKKQLAEVAEVLDLSEDIEFDGQKYWIREGSKKKGPFCQLCYDRDGMLVHLQEHGSHWQCCNCGNSYMISMRSKFPFVKKNLRERVDGTDLKTPIPLFGE